MDRSINAPALAEENVVVGVGVKRRIEIDEIDTRIGKFFAIRKPFQIVAKIQPIHWTTINQNSRLATKSLSLFTEQPPFIGLGAVRQHDFQRATRG